LRPVRSTGGLAELSTSHLLATLGLPPAASMTGRALHLPEALLASPTVHETGAGGFRQRLVNVERERSRILVEGGRA
jgi:hypothetical protein